jgi:energy-coupling factor transporter ATP-binding protein EcfA2
MFRYSAFGVVVDSEIELPELAPTEGETDVTIRLADIPRIEHKATKDEEYVFNPDSGSFRIRNGREIQVDIPNGANPEGVRVLLLGRVMAFLLRQRGWLPLHASGVVIDGQAVLFVGPSGAGKSTMAAAFHARGHIVIADDVAAIRAANGICVTQPGRSRVRLLGDSRILLDGLDLRPEFQLDKHSYDLTGPALPGRTAVKRIYILETGDSFNTAVVSPVLAAALLNRHSFVKARRSEPDVLDAHLRHCAAVAGSASVHRLVRPHSLSLLSQLVGLVEKDLVAGKPDFASTPEAMADIKDSGI